MPEILFPEVIDNSMRKELVKCETAAFYRYEMGIEAAETSKVDLIAGKAFAHGMEVMRKAYYIDGMKAKDAVGKGVAACMASYGDYKPDKVTTKTMQRMGGAIAFYASQYPLDTDVLRAVKFPDGTYAIECQMLEELPILHPTTGNPIVYSGRLDLLALDENNKAWVVDEKTTSQMGDKWANQWFLDSQISGYTYLGRKLLDKNGMQDTEIAGAVINGIAIRKYDYEVQRLPVFRESWEVQRWYDQMVADVLRWRRAFTTQVHNQALDHACAFYNNPCQFAPLCKARNPERLIDGSYVVRRWNPTERD